MRRSQRMVRSISVLVAGILLPALIACGDSDPVNPIEGDTPPSLSLTEIVDSVRAALDLPALAGAIVTIDDDGFEYGLAGTRRANGGAEVTIDDLWHLGSNFKAFTSILAARVVDEGLIEWETRVDQTFPELAESIHQGYQGTTLRDLLAHRSGLPPNPPAAVASHGDTREEQRVSVTEWALKQPPAGRVGTFLYSNTGYMIAAAMVERALETPFEDAMQELVFEPLGIDDAGFGPQAPAGSMDQPVAHRPGRGGWIPQEDFDNLPVYSSAGGAHMSIGSWAKFLREILRIEEGTTTIVSAASGRATISPITEVEGGDAYAMGWLITERDWAGGRALAHDGSNTGNHSLAWVAPKRGLALIAVTNAYDDTPANTTARALDILIGRLLEYHQADR